MHAKERSGVVHIYNNSTDRHVIIRMSSYMNVPCTEIRAQSLRAAIAASLGSPTDTSAAVAHNDYADDVVAPKASKYASARASWAANSIAFASEDACVESESGATSTKYFGGLPSRRWLSKRP